MEQINRNNIVSILGFTEIFEDNFQDASGNVCVEFDGLECKVQIICPMPWIVMEKIKFIHQLKDLVSVMELR